MLNRRILRAKAMQALFAMHQSKTANYHQAHEYFKEAFAPDLNSMEVQDHALLQKQIEESIALFEQNFQEEKINLVHVDAKVENTVKQALIHYHKQNQKDQQTHLSHMLSYAEQVLEHFGHVLHYLDQVSKYIEDRKDSKTLLAGTNVEILMENLLSRNKVFALVSSSEAIVKLWSRHGFEWERELIKNSWLEFASKNEVYQQYRLEKNPDLEQDKKFISEILKECVFKNDTMLKYLEEYSMMWAEDKDTIKSLVLKTIKGIDQNTTTVELPEISSNWEDDKNYFTQLYKYTLEHDKEIEEIIAPKLKNWDLERVALTDKIIMHMGLCEMLYFPSIPTKVSINEYIELCKEYSTPKSKQFVNGILDAISIELTKQGKIKKSGRGLLDNK